MKIKAYFISGILACALLVQATIAKAQVAGCRDPQANNYNAAATTNDGSCMYDSIYYAPPEKTPINTLLQENSGLQWAAGSLWTFNDGGNSPALYRIDTLSNAILQTITLAGATNVDWEDIGFDGSHFYIGDFGNNLNGARTDLKIYKFPISAIPDPAGNPLVTIPPAAIETIQFTYVDQPQPPLPTAPNATRYDCEAMLVDDGKVHLFTKNWIENNTVHYVINSTNAGTYQATAMDTLATNYLVTAADKAQGEEIVVLLGYQVTGAANHFMHILSDYSSGLYFNGNKRKISLPNVLTMGQSEGITFRSPTYGYISNERFATTIGGFPINIPQRLRSFDISTFVSQYVLPAELRKFTGSNANGVHHLEWTFNEPPYQLELQHSINGTEFRTLTALTVSTAGQYKHNALSANNYYRLSWLRESGSERRFSEVILLKKENSRLPGAFHMTPEGKLSFSTYDAFAAPYSFTVISADGKTLAEIPAKNYAAGRNTIFVRPGLPGLVYVVATNGTEKVSRLVMSTNE